MKAHKSFGSGAAVVLIAVAGLARAETQDWLLSSTAEPQEVAQPAAKPLPKPDSVELAALYYYAGQGQAERVEAEARRLRGKYPGFTLPNDLYQAKDQLRLDETPLWQLFEADDVAGLETEIGRLAAAHPGWQPSQDLAAKLAWKKRRIAMKRAAAAKDWPAVIAAGAGIDPARETDIDLLWTMIEAYRQTAMSEPMTKVYRGILLRQGKSRFTEEEIVATLRKAIADFPAADLRQAIGQLSTTPELAIKLQDVSLDMTRHALGVFCAQPGTPPLTEADIAPLEAAAGNGGRTDDLVLLGWYRFKAGNPGEAERWFRAAFARQPTLDNLKSLYASLTAEKKDTDAYALVAANIAIAAGDDALILGAVAPRLAPEVQQGPDADMLKAYAAAVEDSHAADHADILGWHAYNARAFEAASAWFGKSWEWRHSADALKGLALTAQARGDRRGYKKLRGQLQDLYPDAEAELASAAAPKGGKADPAIGQALPKAKEAGYLAAFRAKRYDACVSALEKQAALSADASLVLGWCQLGMGRPAEARRSFETAMRATGRTGADAAYGAALSMLRTGLAERAAEIADGAEMTASRRKEIWAEVHAQRATAAFAAKRYQATLDELNARLELAAEPAGMTRIRAWSHYNLGHLNEARALLERANSVLDDPANRRALALINQRMGIMR